MWNKMKDYFGSNYFEIINYYGEHGYIYSDNQLLLLAMPHNIENLINEKQLDTCNCWYVHYASGNLKRAFEIMPYELEWVAFERGDDKPIKKYNLKKLRKRIEKNGSK